MTTKALPMLDIPALLKRYDLRPSKSLGQNFLQDKQALQKIVESAGIGAEDEVLEIGPGLGNLTRYLARSARHVFAVELDRKFIPPLDEILADYSNVTLVQGDILKLQPSDLLVSAGYVVVANIPYYITSAVIRHLLESTVKPRRVVLTIQKEVAERICSEDDKVSLLALSVQVYGKPVIKANIPAEAFYPSPKVDSAILLIDIYPQPLIPAPLLDTFFQLIKAGFSQKRKTLRNSLSAGLHLTSRDAEALLQAAGIDPQRRAETLDIDEWGRLAAQMQNLQQSQ